MTRQEHLQQLRDAVGHHQAGRLDMAEAIYRKVAAEDPVNADALNLLGAIAQSRAQYPEAKTLYERAIAAAPHVSAIHSNMGNLLLATGDESAAMAAHKRALDLDSRNVDAHIGLGGALYKQGRFEDAVAAFRDVVAVAPEHVGARFNLAQALWKARRLDEAIDQFRAVAALEPSNADIRLTLANVCADGGRHENALTYIRQAIALEPRAEYFSTLGDILLQTGDVESALPAHETAMAKKPHDPYVLHNYGAALHAAKQLAKAQDMFERALKQDAAFIKAYIGLAKVYEHRGLFDRATETLSAALTRDPQSADVRFKLSMLQLAGGDLRNGWRNYAARMEDTAAPHPRRPTPPPYWAGEDLTGKSIVIWTEQGVGDEILHASMFPDVIARAERCIIECSARMAPVFVRSFPGARVAAYETASAAVTTEPVDYQIAAGDLGRLLRETFESFPGHAGYLKADPARTADMRTRYQAIAPKNRVVGLAWRSKNMEVGALKSAELAAWGALLGIPGITFVNLQYGDCTEDLAAVKAKLGVDIVWDRTIDPLKSVDDFCAQVAAMDLVISTSNTTVHAAGALNVPVWLMSANGPGALWYWFRERVDAPWYPSMRIFRHSLQELSSGGVAWWERGIAAAARDLRAI